MRVRILFVIDSFNLGGTEKQCFAIAAHLDATKFEIGIVTFDSQGPLREQFRSLGCRIDEVRFSGGFWRPKSLIQIWRLAQRIREFGPHIVQTFGFYSNVPGILAAKSAGVSIVIASRRDTGEFLSRMQKSVEQWLWRFADRVVVNAMVIREALIQTRVPENKVVVIHNGISCDRGDTHQNPRADATPIIGMVAHFRRQKDHRLFIDAAGLILKYHSEVRFVLVGSGPYEFEIRRYVEDSGLSKYVAFLGSQVGDMLRKTVESFAIAVLASKCNEGLPNVILEAMAAAKPVVATNVGGTREAVVEGETGFLVPPGNPQMLADKVLWLLDHEDEARRMGLEGRQRVASSFSLSKMQVRFENLYLELLNDVGRPS